MADNKLPTLTVDDLNVDVVRSEFSDDVLQTIVQVIISGVDKYLLTPIKVTMNPEEIKLLYREVERSSLIPLSKYIKQQLDEQVGGTFHVIYGRNFGMHVTHERCNFAHIRVDDADVVCWKHGE